jgi:hypothetical protein
MKRLLAVVIVMTALVSGCVVYDAPHRPGPYYGYRDYDRDGVPNRYDRRPDDPRRY